MSNKSEIKRCRTKLKSIAAHCDTASKYLDSMEKEYSSGEATKVWKLFDAIRFAAEEGGDSISYIDFESAK